MSVDGTSLPDRIDASAIAATLRRYSRIAPLLALGLLMGVLLAACGEAAPDIDLSQSSADLGPVTNGEIQTLEIPVRNLGGSELIIEAVTTSCGCTTADITPEVIAAGGSGLLTIRFDSGAHGPDEVGPVMRQVFIASNDPDETEFEFRFTAEIIPAQP